MVKGIMRNIVVFLFGVLVLLAGNCLQAQTEFVFEEKPKTAGMEDDGATRYESSFQSLGVMGMGMAEGVNPVRWFITFNNSALFSDDMGLYLEQQIMLQVAGNTPYTFLGNGVLWYIAGTKKLGVVGKANVGASFVSDIQNSSLFGSAIMGFGSTLGLGLSGGEGIFAFHAMVMVHQTSLLGGHIAPAGNVNILFRL